MGRFKPFVVIIIVAGLLVSSVHGQNYRDQKKLIRLKPNNLMVLGQILTPSGETLSGATVSLFDPPAAKILETIPVDDLGEYMFILEKGKTFGLIVEKEGFFPYYTQFTVPAEPEEEWDNPIQLPLGLQNRYRLIYPPRSTGPSNPEVLEELLNSVSSFESLLVWIPGDPDSVFPLRVSRIKNSFSEAGIEPHRLYIGDTPGSPDQFIHLELINDHSLDVQEDHLNQDDISDTEDDPEGGSISPEKWTLQFVASKKKLQASGLKGITSYKVFEGKDGFYRYTYGIYNSREEANSGKAYLKEKGFDQSFAKKIEDLQKL